jgi:hypothetical protein
MGDLGTLLRERNAKYSYTKKTRENGQEWIKKRGGNLNPLIERVKVIKKQHEKKNEDKKVEEDCYFYLPELNYQNQEIYLNKNFEYGIFSTMQSIMSSQKYRGNYVRRALEKAEKNRNILGSQG